MTILLPALAVAFAAFCVWLGVRIVNRRERWAKWTLAAVIGLPVLYVASFGPACWWFSRSFRPTADWACQSPTPIRIVPSIYSPVILTHMHMPPPLKHAIRWYATRGGEWVWWGRSNDPNNWDGGWEGENGGLCVFYPRI
jgi:hypothetical protein